MRLVVFTDAQSFQVFVKSKDEFLCIRPSDVTILLKPEGHSTAKACAFQKGGSFSFDRGCIGSGERLLGVPIHRDKSCAVEERFSVGFEQSFCDLTEAVECRYGGVQARLSRSFRLVMGQSGDRGGLERCEGAQKACDGGESCDPKLGIVRDYVAERFVLEDCGSDRCSCQYSAPQIGYPSRKFAHAVFPQTNMGAY